MVKCPRCGYENSSSSTYCDNCAFLLADLRGKKIKNTKRTKSWNVGFGKKIIIVLGIIVIAFLLFSFVYNNSQPSNDETLNVIYDNGSQYQSSSYPFKAVVSYEGSWSAKVGDPNYLIQKSGSGTNTIALDCAAWDDVQIEAQKNGGEGELTIQILRNGKVVAENSTTDGSESVSLFYDS